MMYPSPVWARSRQVPSHEKWLLRILPLLLLFCISLWLGLSVKQYVWIDSIDDPDNGMVWDLRNFEFAKTNARLRGDVEFIPNALLTPVEFTARLDEAVSGSPPELAVYSTSRMRILVPDAYYTFSRISTDYSDRIFVNGLWLHDIGIPSDTITSGVPNTARITFTIRPIDGVIEIIQQTSNFNIRGKNRLPQNWLMGNANFASSVLIADYTVSIILGCYLILFLIFSLLFLFLRPTYRKGSYLPTLYLALPGFMWFLRSGITGSRIFAVLFPWLSGMVSMRIEYISLPVAAFLVVEIINELFPGVLQKIFCLSIAVSSACYIILFAFLGTSQIAYVVLSCHIIYLISIIYIISRFVMKIRKLDLIKGVFLLGSLIFIYGAVRDFSYYGFSAFMPLLPPFSDANFTQITAFAFALCMAISTFISTMNEVESAKQKEHELNLRNISLEGEIILAKEKLESLQKLNEQQAIEDLTLGDLRLNTVSNRAYLNGADIFLKQKEFLLMLTLVKNSDRGISGDKLYETVWEAKINNNKNTLYKHISELRKKLEQADFNYTIGFEQEKGYFLERLTKK